MLRNFFDPTPEQQNGSRSSSSAAAFGLVNTTSGSCNGGRPPRKKSADLGSSRCEVDIKRVYDAVIRPGNLSNAGLILPTCRLFRLSFAARQERERRKAVE